eukprot:TRINITY_DN564_c0_g1_i5.p1 TRINITY_DN564_c0_g1~~TRINITY_DN564_c0_g1_i5.p1  ORF type:complete len:438 (-),score=118.28 TRINITY_DN564_c0_g1_i5:157-1470(-)
MEKKIKAMPKVELHKHLEGAVRFDTLRELYQKTVLSTTNANTTNYCKDEKDALDKQVSEYFCNPHVISSLNDLTDFLNKFAHTQKVLDNVDLLERIAFEVCEDSYLENIRVLELRYSPNYILQGHSSLTYDSIHQAIVQGCEKATARYPLCVGLIGIIDRCLSISEATKVVDFIIANRDTFIGIDMANDELKYRAAPFVPLFRKAHAAGLRVTIHSGEVNCDAAPSWVKEAIDDLFAERIGHGIHIMKDKRIVQYAKDRAIVFECCPSSNYLIQTVTSLRTHPMLAMMQSGLKVTINTDDPGFFRVSLCSEIDTAIREMGLSFDQVEQCMQNAYDASFIPEEVKCRFWPSSASSCSSSSLCVSSSMSTSMSMSMSISSSSSTTASVPSTNDNKNHVGVFVRMKRSTSIYNSTTVFLSSALLILLVAFFVWCIRFIMH